jgi:hypothetical protein
MADRTREIEEDRFERSDVLLWLAFLAGPISWIVAELASYSLAPTACWSRQHLWLHLVPLATLSLAAGGAALARARALREPAGSTEAGDARSSRRRFMATLAFWACLGFALVILATEVPNLILGVCD